MTTTPAELPGADVTALRRHVGAGADTPDTALQPVLDEAEALVLGWLGTATDKVPGPLLVRAVIEVASELYHRRNAPGGVLGQFADLGAAPVRMARDPMLGAYPLLQPFVGGGFG